MGIEYFIVDDEKLEYFELGKGNWREMPLTNKDNMLQYIIDTVKPGFEQDTPDEYYEWVVDKVLKFMKNRTATIINDSKFWEKYYMNESDEYEGLLLCKLVDDRYKVD